MGSGSSRQKKKGGSQSGSGKAKVLLKTLGGHTGGINCMDISMDGAYLLTGSDDRTARVWDLVTYENKVVLEGHTGYVSCCKIWQGRFALTGSMDKSIRKWNMLSGNCVLKMEIHRGMVNRLLVNGCYMFSSSYDRTIICWDIENGQASRIFRGHKQSVLPILYVKTADHDPHGAQDIDRNKDALLTGSMDCTARIWNIHSGTSLRTFRGHKGAILCLTLDRNKTYLYTGSTDFSIKKWNIANGSILKTFKGHEGSVICLEISHKLLYSASVDCTSRCWVAEFGDTTRKYSGHEHMISDMKFHNGLLITSSGDNTVRVFDAKLGSLKRTFKGHKYAVNCILAVDSTIFSASYDGTIKIWNIRDLVKGKLSALASEESSSSLISSAPSISTDHQIAGSSVSVENERSTWKRPEREYSTSNSRNRDKVQFPRLPDGENMIPFPTSIMEVEDSKPKSRADNYSRTQKRRGTKQANNRIAPTDRLNLNNNNDKSNDGGKMLVDCIENGEIGTDLPKEAYISNSSNPGDSASNDHVVSVHSYTHSKTPSSSSLASNARRTVPFPLSRGSSKVSVFANDALIPKENERTWSEVRQNSVSNESWSGSMSLPSSSNSFRGLNGVHKRESSDVSPKRVKTEETSSSATVGGSRVSSEDLALVDEEIRMIAMETDSTSTGYHSDKSSPQSPNHSSKKPPVNGKRNSTKSRLKSAIPSPIIEQSTPRRASTKSALWATCSNSVEVKEPTKPHAIGRTTKVPSSAKVRTTLSVAEGERLEYEILKMP